ncbi:hypothetical protein Misp02_26580 [Microtetraspora sp. NBRC 16547]|nr:hypothetical protein Misp02_26580 [Microtetraspora sp. NBRC 16547]
MPRTDAVLAAPELVAAQGRLGRAAVKKAVASAQRRVRQGELGPDEVVGAAVAALPPRATSLRPVINATGVLLHTNLGRAPLSAAAIDAVTAAAGPTDVEFDLVRGTRARRGRGAMDALAQAVPDAEDVHVVNNNAAALVLTLAALEATLRGPVPPLGEALHADPEALAARAAVLAGTLAEAGLDARAVPSEANVGGGGAPGVTLPSAAVSLPERFAGPLRTGEPPVVGRIEGGRLLIDLRAVPGTRDGDVARAVLAVEG